MAILSRNSATPATNAAGAATAGSVAASARRRQRSSARPVWMEDPHPLVQVAKSLTLVAIVVVMVFPLVYVVAVSFSSARDVMGGGLILFPANPTLDAYDAIFQGGVVTRSLTITAMVTIIGVAAQMFFTTTMAYGLSRPGVLGSRAVLMLVLGALLFYPGIIPSYLLVKEFGLINSYAALVAPQLIGAFNLIVVRNFFMNIPQELLDAARVDGANDLQVFVRIVLPLSKAVLAVIALFYGVSLWNQFFNALIYLTDAGKWPIQVVLRQYVLMGNSLASAAQLDPNQPPPPPDTIKMAIVVVATVPILLVYPFLQKYFTKGVLTGAIKG